MAKRTFITIAILAAVGLLVVAGYRLMFSRESAYCGFCHRAIAENIKVIAEVDGLRRKVCCARCAISQANQLKKPLRLISVTDYISNQRLDPNRAYFVDGSRKVFCDHSATMVDETKHIFEMKYDRCFPGTYAFARRNDADAFVRENGGKVMQLAELMQEVGAQ